MFQNELFKQILGQIGDSSLNEAVSEVLDIGYDAAHRRTSLKSKLSLKEGILLAKHFNLSIDYLFSVSSKNIVAVEKTELITNEQELENYYTDSYNSLIALIHRKGSSIIYSAKDVPVFYTLNNEILSKFKAYVWLKLLDPKFKTVSFEAYVPKLSLIEAGKRLGALSTNISTVEIWDITTVNSILKQVHFYFNAHQLSSENALGITAALNQLIKEIENKLLKNDGSFLMYYNELLLMNNTVMIRTPSEKSLYIPFTILSYYKTNDEYTCNQAEQFLEKQLQNSKLLNSTGEKEQKTFFDKMYTKIKALEQLIEATNQIDFE